MKKLIKFSVVIVLLLTIAVSGVFALAACNDKEEDKVDKGEPIVKLIKPENDLPYLIKTYTDGTQCDDDFRIVTFADPHFSGNKEKTGDVASLTLIENTLKMEKPDLVVFLGDICLGENAEAAINNIGELFEKYGRYWGYVLGNHDGESDKGPARSDLPALYSKFEHCVVDPVKGISGDGNAIVNIKNTDGKVLQSLIFMDTGNYVKKDICVEYGFKYKEGYDFIKYDQIDWYKSTLRSIAAKNGSMPKSIMFTHIPLTEYRTAYNEADTKGTVIYGRRREPECDSPFNTGMFAAILEINSTKAVICGHDHTSDYNVQYQGVNLLYSQGSSFNSYFMRKDLLARLSYALSGEAEFSDGHTQFAINKDGDMTITPLLNQNKPALFDGLSEEQRKELFLDETLPK